MPTVYTLAEKKHSFVQFVSNLTLLLQDGFEYTDNSAEDGEKFLQELADDTIESLRHLTISHEDKWFANDRDGCMTPLLELLARQTSLESLTMQGDPEGLGDGMFSEDQKEQIVKVVTEKAPDCQIELGKKDYDD